MQSPAMILPDANKGVQYLIQAIGQGGVPQKTLELVHMRASQRPHLALPAFSDRSPSGSTTWPER
jgi:hypothetical protein